MDSTQINNSNTLEALDCISRQAAIDALFELSRNTAFDIPAEPNATKYYRDALYDACQLIKSLPPVQPKRMNGGWITSDDLWETGICSCCGWDSQEPVSYAVTMFKFCPDCGADMRGEQESE